MEQLNLLNRKFVDPLFIQRFDGNHGKGSGDRLVSLLEQNCNTFTDISKEFNLSKERIRQLYNKEVRHTLSVPRTGHQRIRACTIVKPHRNKFPEYVLAVWKRARQKGLPVTYINTIPSPQSSCSSVYTLKHVININGNNCKIVNCNNIFNPNGGKYGSYLRIALTNKTKTYDFLIARVKATDLFYIIPTHELGSIIKRPKVMGITGTCAWVYLPVGNGVIKDRSWSPWNKYKEAWYLLK